MGGNAPESGWNNSSQFTSWSPAPSSRPKPTSSFGYQTYDPSYPLPPPTSSTSPHHYMHPQTQSFGYYEPQQQQQGFQPSQVQYRQQQQQFGPPFEGRGREEEFYNPQSNQYEGQQQQHQFQQQQQQRGFDPRFEERFDYSHNKQQQQQQQDRSTSVTTTSTSQRDQGGRGPYNPFDIKNRHGSKDFGGEDESPSTTDQQQHNQKQIQDETQRSPPLPPTNHHHQIGQQDNRDQHQQQHRPQERTVRSPVVSSDARRYNSDHPMNTPPSQTTVEEFVDIPSGLLFFFILYCFSWISHF